MRNISLSPVYTWPSRRWWCPTIYTVHVWCGICMITCEISARVSVNPSKMLNQVMTSNLNNYKSLVVAVKLRVIATKKKVYYFIHCTKNWYFKICIIMLFFTPLRLWFYKRLLNYHKRCACAGLRVRVRVEHLVSFYKYPETRELLKYVQHEIIKTDAGLYLYKVKIFRLLYRMSKIFRRRL